MRKLIAIISFQSLLFAGLAQADNKHVIELFTSQGCYSCPAADEFLGELIENRDDLIALEFHVDYWDDLVYGSAGRWKDPFSDPDYTLRQRLYAAHISDRVYTPQAVINGISGMVGSDRRRVLRALKKSVPESVKLRLSRTSETLEVELSGGGREAGVWLVWYDLKHVTDVPAGENYGKTLTNYNVVRSMNRIGDWDGGTKAISVADFALPVDQGCAVLVQSEDNFEILGAASCRS